MNYINRNDCSLIIIGIGRRAYVNSECGRTDLVADLTGKDDALLARVLEAWGDSPTVEDIVPEENE